MLQLWLQQGLSETARHGTFECHRNDRNPMVLTLPRKEHLSVLKGKKITHPFPGLCALINPMSGIIRKESQHCQQSVPVSTGWHHSWFYVCGCFASTYVCELELQNTVWAASECLKWESKGSSARTASTSDYWATSPTPNPQDQSRHPSEPGPSHQLHFIYYCVYTTLWVLRAHGGQKRATNLLEVEFRWWWAAHIGQGSNSSLLKEKHSYLWAFLIQSFHFFSFW